MEWIQDLIAVLGQSLNSISQGVMAMGLGFSLFATSFGFGAAALLSLVMGNVVPLSFQAESLALMAALSDDKHERRSILIVASVLLLAIGLTPFADWLTNISGTAILSAMMAGVGLMLSQIGYRSAESSPLVGWSSLVIALLLYLTTQDLALTIALSVIGASAIAYFKNGKQPQPVSADVTQEGKLSVTKPKLTFNVIKGALSFIALNLAGNISYGLITGQMTGITPNPANVNDITMIEGISNLVASLFGGAPVGAIISATGDTPHPLFSNVLMTLFIAVILFVKILPKMSRYIPSASLAGFLMVLGMFVIFPDNATAAMTSNMPLAAGATVVITAISDPFTGLVSGTILRYLLPLLGL
ncbi:MAG: NCS2 family permease [Aerococcus sp.]|nr:NCS2 family permease [Aerococcus sp.]